MCRREMARQEEDLDGKEKIINDYKTICSQMSLRIEKLQASHKEEIDAIKKVWSYCEFLWDYFGLQLPKFVFFSI